MMSNMSNSLLVLPFIKVESQILSDLLMSVYLYTNHFLQSFAAVKCVAVPQRGPVLAPLTEAAPLQSAT